MQTSLETLGQLERRLTMSRAASRRSRARSSKRLARLAKTVKVPGFRPGQGAAARWSRSNTARRCAPTSSPTPCKASFNDAMREQNLRVAGYPRIEPQDRSGARRTRSSSRRSSRSIPRSKVGDLSDVTIERPQVEVGAGRRRAHDRRAAPAAHDATSTSTAAPRDGRSRRSSISPARSTASSSPAGQAKDFAIIARRRPDAAGVRDRGHRHERRRDARRSRSRFPADYHGKEVAGKAARVRR